MIKQTRRKFAKLALVACSFTSFRTFEYVWVVEYFRFVTKVFICDGDARRVFLGVSKTLHTFH